MFDECLRRGKCSIGSRQNGIRPSLSFPSGNEGWGLSLFQRRLRHELCLGEGSAEVLGVGHLQCRFLCSLELRPRFYRPEDGCTRFLSSLLGRADSRIQQPGFGLRLWHHHHSYRSWNCQSRTWIRFFVGPRRTVSGASFCRLRLGIQYCQNRQRQVRNRTLRKARLEVLSRNLKRNTIQLQTSHYTIAIVALYVWQRH